MDDGELLKAVGFGSRLLSVWRKSRKGSCMSHKQVC